MSKRKKITPPLTDEVVEDLKIGDVVLISGTIYTARDVAHKRMIEALNNGEELPFDIKGQIIYYAGPTPPRPGKIIGACGPTSNYRMDPYAPILMEKGLKGMIGKGSRSKKVIEAMKKYKAVYFATFGGGGAFLSKAIKEAEIIAYKDLGPEAIRRLVVEDFLAIVVNDIYGNDLYEEARKRFEIK